ncbi:MAG: relaxase/mobilization nuclease domain-containing protein [Aquidulcibacter sp.]|uniref:relaxase/mobilization nuclease domain-containing protein n=1 Tax=Aquidulcibacter sp. TaxID=2052990 RepID=UPI0022BE7545|nr:relaxase/mobilization nuclease domain-containing protein [Aquidulcibacter sp.]
MILKASQRSGAKQLSTHLLRTDENEHVELHEINGFVSETLQGAMQEAYALSKGTKCKQFLFSVSLSPPAHESVRVEVFEKAINDIEERLGLQGQPRIIVFHEKEGRRHAHAVWSRIDSETMTAKHLPFFKTKLNSLAKQIYLENGWAMPKGFENPKLRDPTSFTLKEWQQAKRANGIWGLDPRELKSAVQDCWKRSDGATAFTNALEERGLYLARGDRRGHVVLTLDGEPFALSRLIDGKTKDVNAKLGDPNQLRSVDETKALIGEKIAPRLSSYIAEAKRMAVNAMKPLVAQKQQLTVAHQTARQEFDTKLKERWDAEQRERSSRTRKGWAGVWDFMTGRYFKVRKQNELEVQFAKERDRTERHGMVAAQLKERQDLQTQIKSARRREAEQVLALYRDAAKFRRMRESREQASARVRDKGLDLG